MMEDLFYFKDLYDTIDAEGTKPKYVGVEKWKTLNKKAISTMDINVFYHLPRRLMSITSGLSYNDYIKERLPKTKFS